MSPAVGLPPTASRRWWLDAVTLIALFAAAASLAHGLLATPIDDSYIYLRVAANIADGHGWLYNPGDVANPATSTSFVLLLAALGSLIGFGPHTLAASFALCLFTLLAVHYVAWRRSDGWSIAVLVCVVIAMSSRLLASVGMETALLLAAVSATAFAYRQRGDSLLVGVLAGFTALTRPEGLLILGLIGLLELARRHLAWRSTLAAIATILPWLVYATWRFGTPLSQTAAIKSAQRHYGWWAQQPDFLVGFLQQPAWPWITLPLALLGLALSARRWLRGDAFTLLCIAFGLLQVVAYQILGAPLGYPWYFAPGNLAVDLAVVLVVAGTSTWLTRRVRADSSARHAATPSLVTAACVLVGAIGLTRAGMAPTAWPAPPQLGADYRHVAEWLRAHARPDDEVAATEIGMIGWFSGLRVLDIHGLVHPDALPALRARNLHWWYDEGRRPRFVVAHVPAWHGEPGSAETWPEALSAAFFGHYRDAYEHATLRVYERREDAGAP